MNTPNHNAPCPCGSGKTHANCCLKKGAATQMAPGRWGATAQAHPQGKQSGNSSPPPASIRFNLSSNFSGAGQGTPATSMSGFGNAQTDFNRGNTFHLAGKLTEAIDSYRKAVSIKPDYVEAHGNLGIALHKLGRLDEAIACYRKVLQLKPNLADTHYSLGDILLEQGKLDEAISCCRTALMLNPKHAEAYNNLGNALRAQGKMEEAIGCFRSAIAIKPAYAKAHYNLGRILQSQGKQDEAIDSYRKAIASKPDYFEVYFNLGNAQQNQGQLEEAAESYRKTISFKPDFVEAHNNLGIALHGQGKVSEAISSFQNAISLRPGFVDAYNNLGNILREQDKLNEAIACYRKALSIKPDDADTHTNLGFTLLLSGAYLEGWKEYWRGGSRNKSDYPVRALPDNPLFARRPDELLPANLHGIRITLLKDQGLGDELFFLRFAGELRKRGAWVNYVADPRMIPFLRRANWVDSVTAENSEIENPHVALLISELPMVLGMAGAADIPPPVALQVLPEKRQEIALRLARNDSTTSPLIGITWRGGTDSMKPGNRHLFKEIPPAQLAAALRGIQATFVIVQRNPQPGEIAAFEAALGQTVLDLSKLNDDLEGMLALMEHLDDYVGVSNTNMHLRASVGKTARVLVPHLQDFRWMAAGDSSPWFPGFSIYRRAPDNNWDVALEQLKCHLLQNHIR